MPDTEVGQILTELYAQTMASNRQSTSQPAATHGSAHAEFRSQFRPEYQMQPSPAQSSTPGSSNNNTGHTPNAYPPFNTYNPTSQPPNYSPNTPSCDGLPSPDRGKDGSASGSAAGQSKRTRTRPTKSCERCRSKKLRCDREFPCASCKKGGKSGSDCSYRDGWEPWDKEEDVPAAKKAKGGDTTSGFDTGGNLSVVEKMVRIGEAMGGPGHGPQSPNITSSTRYPDGKSQPSAIANSYASSSTLGRLDIKGQRSRYVSPGDKMRIMDRFEDPKNFITNGFKDPDMVDIMRELSGYQKALLPKQPKIVLTTFEREHLITEMFRAVPEGWLYGFLQNKLFLNWETVQRVLHIPTFSKECEDVAAAQASGAPSIPSHLGDWVLPQIMVATTLVSRLDDPAVKQSTTGRLTEEQIVRNIEMARTWLDGLRGKPNTCIHTLQTRTLLLLAQQANLCSTHDLWMDSAALVRRAMSMGLHQDPETYSEMSKLDKEMRRKLWTSLVELDMQFSLAAGMPAAVRSSNWNIRGLVNVDDSELTIAMTDYPVGKSETTWTTALPQIALSASLKDRLNITSWLGGNLNVEQDAPALVAHAHLLEKTLRSLPPQFRGLNVGGANINNKRIDRLFISIMLDMSIRRPLVALYRTIVFSPQVHRFPEARKGALRCSLAILSHLDALDPAIADLSIVKSRDYLNLFHILYKNDIIQAALLVCHEIRSFDQAPTPTSNDVAYPEESFPQTKHSLTRAVENTLHSLLARLGDFGSDLKDILPLSVVLQSVRAEGTIEEMREVMQRGAERVLTACRRALPGVQTQQMGSEKQTTTPKASGDKWNSVVLQNRAVTATNDFNTMSVDEFDFQNFDFGWGDWSMNQSWV
ncbi:hypothetical protein ONS95_010727 [Cadophora gregata]|uniref:uncharacterized protein n=1 Tax=Cadophora gregata TaxID=51156 RepID=UPI0026DC1D18|nr:uncharacterized protein ONS95_010727 [Cadophora gregata]KAK0122497.1 hypothetical protein ONS95_010727 [Cadophora gregata]KAK0127976.1 hypothetical protein ONS96_007470 [Cadophora gregata f. sp. sojae]